MIGRPLLLGEQTREVTGVLPEGVSYPIMLGPPADLYIPYVPPPAERAANAPRLGTISAVGRLRPGVTVEQVRADANRFATAVVVPLHEQVVGPANTWLRLVLAAVGFVLLVACANVANLLLARAATRAPEFATCEALGASRGRLAVGLLLEGLILAAVATATAVVLSFWGVEIARASLPPGLTRVSTIAINGRVLAAAIAAAVLCGLVFASAPACLAARSDLSGLLKAGGGPLIGSRGRNRSLSAFLVADVAFVCVLLVATTLVVTTFILITTADLGFDRHDVMSIWFQRSLNGVAEPSRPAAVSAFRADLLERAKSVPGVTHVAISSVGSPLNGSRTGASIIVPGYGETDRRDMEWRAVTPDYFGVMDMRLMRGRLLQESDRAGAPLVMLINDVAARRYFGDRDPVGQVVTYRYPPPGPTAIVGVVKGGYNNGPETGVQPEVYVPLDQQPYHDIDSPRFGGLITVGGLLVRTQDDPRGSAGAVREAIRPALLGREPQETQFVDDDFRRLTAGRRFNAQLMTVFGLIAVMIGALGVYGTMAHFVAQQVRAIGLRMALGASPSDVRRSVLWGALARVVPGVAIGLAGARAASSALEAFVFGVRPTDPVVYVAVGGFLAVVGLAGALVPALRAARLDPLTALRHE